MFPLIYPLTRVKIVAILLAAIWVAGTAITRSSDFNSVIVTTTGAAIGGYLWYRLMCWLLIGRWAKSTVR